MMLRSLRGIAHTGDLHLNSEFHRIKESGAATTVGISRLTVSSWILRVTHRPVKIKNQLCHPAYPALEYKGLVFGYFGPPEDIPDFPIYGQFMRFQGTNSFRTV